MIVCVSKCKGHNWPPTSLLLSDFLIFHGSGWFFKGLWIFQFPDLAGIYLHLCDALQVCWLIYILKHYFNGTSAFWLVMCELYWNLTILISWHGYHTFKIGVFPLTNDKMETFSRLLSLSWNDLYFYYTFVAVSSVFLMRWQISLSRCFGMVSSVML